MKTVAIIATKGGNAKSSTAIHLACEAERFGITTAIVDLDPQCSCAQFADSRESETPVVTSIQPQRLENTLTLAKDAGARLVFVDTPPHAAQGAIIAAENADLIIVPCRPGILDLRAISDTAKIIRLTGKRAFVVLSAVPNRAPRIEDDATAAVKHYGLQVAPIVIHHRSAFSKSLSVGMGVHEFEPNGRAAEETTALFKWLRRELSI